jgi:hypothetical protein
MSIIETNAFEKLAGNCRPLTEDETSLVSGGNSHYGDIVVTGSTYANSPYYAEQANLYTLLALAHAQSIAETTGRVIVLSTGEIVNAPPPPAPEENEDNIPEIIVTAPPTLPDTFFEASFGQQLLLLQGQHARLDPLLIDIQAGTNLTGDNPNDPRNADRIEQINRMLLEIAVRAALAGELP